MWHILVQWQLQGFSTDAKKQSSFAWDTRIQDRSSYLFSMCNIAVGVIRVCNMHFLIIRVICRNHPGAMTAAKSSLLMPKINHLFCPTHSDVQCCLVCRQQFDLQKPSYYRNTPLLHVTHATEAWFAETIMVQLQLQRILHWCQKTILFFIWYTHQDSTKIVMNSSSKNSSNLTQILFYSTFIFQCALLQLGQWVSAVCSLSSGAWFAETSVGVAVQWQLLKIHCCQETIFFLCYNTALPFFIALESGKHTKDSC